MKSSRDIFKIGVGPSSSHTMGPVYATERFLKENPTADFFKVILYGSLSQTGKGHGTDRAIIATISAINDIAVFIQYFLSSQIEGSFNWGLL